MEPKKLYFVMRLQIHLDPSNLTGLKYKNSLFSAAPGKDYSSLYAPPQADIRSLEIVRKFVPYPGHVVPQLY